LVPQHGREHHGKVAAVAHQSPGWLPRLVQGSLIQLHDARQLLGGGAQLHLVAACGVQLHAIPLRPEDMDHQALHDAAQGFDLTRQVIQQTGLSAGIRQQPRRSVECKRLVHRSSSLSCVCPLFAKRL